MSEVSTKNSCDIWKSSTFGNAVEKTFKKNSKVSADLKEQLKELGLLDKSINGYSVQGLQKTHEGGGMSVSYTDTFFEVEKLTGDCHPIDYLYFLVEKANKKGMSKGKTTGLLARSMRTFASLLRDRDFASVMNEIVKKEGLKFRVIRDPKEDSENHTDVLVKVGDTDFRIWLFQFSRMGLPHDIERVSGDRGNLPKGIHVLCPLKSEIMMEYEKTNNSISIVEKRLERNSAKIRECKKGAKLYADLVERKKDLSNRLSELDNKKNDLKDKVEHEVNVRNGWYFYSDDKVKQVLSMIKKIVDGKNKPRTHSEVKKILNSPKEFLSEISAFQV